MGNVLFKQMWFLVGTPIALQMSVFSCCLNFHIRGVNAGSCLIWIFSVCRNLYANWMKTTITTQRLALCPIKEVNLQIKA